MRFRIPWHAVTFPIPPYVVLEKALGQTPLQAIDAWRQEHLECAHIPASYAGRLDPMATGKLLVLLGDECKRQDKYRGLDKEYEIEILLDLSTDTGDVLGMPAFSDSVSVPDTRALSDALKAQQGAHDVPYPAFSSKTVNGKPLFQYALEGALESIAIPTHTERIYRTQLLAIEQVSKGALEERIGQMLALAPRAPEPSKALGADFRQDAIRAAWTSLFDSLPERTFTVARLRVACASGTYMRSLAARIGETLGTRGMALSIHRSRIGTYRAIFGVGFWAGGY